MAFRRWRNLAISVLPALAFAATFGVFFVDKNREARTVFSSGRGLLTLAAVVVGYVLIAVMVKRLVRWSWVAPLTLAVVVLGLAAWIVRPYYSDETVEQQLVLGPIEDASAADEPSPRPTEPAEAAGVPGGPASSAASPTAVRISVGDIKGIDHDATGRISVIEQASGVRVVRFEDFDIEGTPDPVVYLAEGDDVEQEGGVDLGGLDGNRGDILDIRVPADTEVGPGWTVLVWCQAFAVPIANATQAAA